VTTHEERIAELAKINVDVKEIVGLARQSLPEAERELAVVEAELMGIRLTLAIGVEALSSLARTAEMEARLRHGAPALALARAAERKP
jgi:hypothetical protein